ncbi:hypothetical protein [Burkholderia lata]|nr:hypothetical protein [Burkholderia lata]
MRTLHGELADVDRAIQANVLSAAKQALRRINGTKKHYRERRYW